MATAGYPTPQELRNASTDAKTLEKFGNDPAGVANINRVGNDVENMETLRQRMLDAASDAANLQTYLSYDSPSEKRMVDDTTQPAGTRGRVSQDANLDNNGDWDWDGDEWKKSPLQPASTTQVRQIWVQLGDSQAQILVDSNFVPLVVDGVGNVPFWLDNNLLSGLGLAESLMGGLARAVSFQVRDGFAPLAVDDANNVPVWLEGDLLGAVGLTPALAETVAQAFQGRFAPRNAPVGVGVPRATDGRTLYMVRAVLSRILKSVTGTARIMVAGDSWAEQTAISQALADTLYGRYGKSGEGWIAVNAGNKLNGVTLSRSGAWNLYDASNLSAGVPPYGCGIDGHSISTTGTNAVLTIGNVVCTEMKIFYSNQDGAFRWRVDGGAWTTVAGSGDGSIGVVEISGLADEAHAIEYDTSVNTSGGVVAIHGHQATREAVAGVELHKVGNGGQTGTGMLQIAGNIAPYAQRLIPHVVFVILGTNDYRTGAPTENYRAALQMWLDEVRSQVPDCGFVFVAPSQSDAVALTPLATYRDIAYEVAIENGAEFISLYDEWGPYAAMSALGQWGDSLHPSVDGGEHIAQSAYQRFLNF